MLLDHFNSIPLQHWVVWSANNWIIWGKMQHPRAEQSLSFKYSETQYLTRGHLSSLMHVNLKHINSLWFFRYCLEFQVCYKWYPGIKPQARDLFSLPSTNSPVNLFRLHQPCIREDWQSSQVWYNNPALLYPVKISMIRNTNSFLKRKHH